MDWFVSGLGAVMVVLVLRDIFHTLGHPGFQGRLSRVVLGTTWRVSRGRRMAGLAGPLAMLTVIGVWGLLAVVGWALVYLPHLPGGFTFASGRAAGDTNPVLDALYISLVTISTLGLGDAIPVSGWLRVANPLEALFGFALLTVAVSWVLQIYPALTRRRVLSIRLMLLRRADTLDHLDSSWAAGVLEGLATSIVGVRVDLSEYAETYYFREDEMEASLAATLGYAAELARAGSVSPRSDVKHASTILTCALDDLAHVLDDRFLHVGGLLPEVIDAFALDHGHPRV
ncbi:MAG: two pore domain potassium channel family protein [Flavobacterium sp.]|nr:two pore domain potassium channel family protein [Aeromicrobium sp.]